MLLSLDLHGVLSSAMLHYHIHKNPPLGFMLSNETSPDPTSFTLSFHLHLCLLTDKSLCRLPLLQSINHVTEIQYKYGKKNP
jgi:hypothetical protein